VANRELRKRNSSLKMAKKKLYHTVFIACEGSNSEPNYLGRLVEAIDEERLVRVTIFPKPKFGSDEESESEKKRRSDPVGLVRDARSKLDEGFDEAWAVFDRDGHAGLAEAFKLANKPVTGKKVRIAFSSIAFEHWVLLHFERSTTAFSKSDNLIQERFHRGGLLPAYSKSNQTDIYPVLIDKTRTAFENAAWLRHQIMRDLPLGYPLFELNPYTDLDELVRTLMDIDIRFAWVGLEQEFLGSTFRMRVAKTEEPFFFISLFNGSQKTLVFNGQHVSQYFSILGRPDLAPDIAQTTVIPPNNSGTFRLEFPGLVGQDAVLVFQIGRERLMVG